MDEIFCSKKISVNLKMSLLYKAHLDMRKDLFMILQKEDNSTCKGNVSLMGISKKAFSERYNLINSPLTTFWAFFSR